MLNKLKQRYERELFNPGILGVFINPFYFARKGLHKNIADLAINLKGNLLDIGCGTKPYENLCRVDKYIGLEIDTDRNRKNKKVDYFFDGKTIPFSENFFDSLISNEVLEHVFNPDVFLAESNRVLKLGGLILITVPFVWDEHEQPFDYARYSSFGLKHLLTKSGFIIIEHKKSNNGVELIFQLMNAYLYKVTHTQSPYINLLIMLSLMAPINMFGLLLSRLLPRNNDLYLDNIVLAKKVKDV